MGALTTVPLTFRWCSARVKSSIIKNSLPAKSVVFFPNDVSRTALLFINLPHRDVVKKRSADVPFRWYMFRPEAVVFLSRLLVPM